MEIPTSPTHTHRPGRIGQCALGADWLGEGFVILATISDRIAIQTSLRSRANTALRI